MSAGLPAGMLRLHPVTADADRALAAHVADLVGASADEIRVGRHCPACGAVSHGRPWARVAGRADGIAVSLSRSGPHLLTAVRVGGGIGVDLEEVAAVEGGWDPTLVLHPAEGGQDRTVEDRARLWAGKEAVLKLAGTGLRTPMTQVRLADHDVREAPAPAGFVVQVALGPA